MELIKPQHKKNHALYPTMPPTLTLKLCSGVRKTKEERERAFLTFGT